MDGKKAVWCFVLFVLVINVTAAVEEPQNRWGKRIFLIRRMGMQ